MPEWVMARYLCPLRLYLRQHFFITMHPSGYPKNANVEKKGGHQSNKRFSYNL